MVVHSINVLQTYVTFEGYVQEFCDSLKIIIAWAINVTQFKTALFSLFCFSYLREQMNGLTKCALPGFAGVG